MAKFYSEAEIDSDLIRKKRVAVLGYGGQGHAHALNLRDSGVDVRIGLYPESRSKERAQAAGFSVISTPEAVGEADIVVFCTPDETMAEVYSKDVEPHLKSHNTLVFAHGFSIHYGLISPPKDVDVILVAPKGPGKRLRQEYLIGSGLPAVIAVHQDCSGNASSMALSYASAIGSARALIMETTFREETETDLFGEQAVLCGGIPALILAGFKTLVEAGYQPEAAYFECLHEAKYIVDLLHEAGLARMREAISDTAEWGGYLAGERVIGDASKEAMSSILRDIQDGSFARRWVEESKSGRTELLKFRSQNLTEPVEVVGEDIRKRLPFLKPS